MDSSLYCSDADDDCNRGDVNNKCAGNHKAVLVALLIIATDCMEHRNIGTLETSEHRLGEFAAHSVSSCAAT
jgi:hypothetical protein